MEFGRINGSMKRSRGERSKSRHKLKQGKFSIAEALQDFEEGEKVKININPSVHDGMPHPKFQGFSGEVVGKKGRSLEVEVSNGKQDKKVIAMPEHLSKIEENKGGKK